MALIGWRVEWKSSFRDYEGVVIEHSKDQVVVWEFRDLMTYEWNLSQKDYKRWNPALKEFANYHRGLLMKSNIKQSEVCRKVIGIIDALDNSPAMILAKKLALQIENGKLQAAIMDESEEEERQLVEKKKSQSSDNDKLLRKTVEFTLPENIKKQLWEEKHESDESEEEDDDEDDDDDEEDEEEDDDDDESDETSDQDPDSDEEDSKHPSPHEKKNKSRPKSASKCSPEKKDQVDLKVMILHTKQLRGFSVTLNEEGFQAMLIKLQQDYGKDINVFYRDEDGDVLNILSIDDLLYAYRSEEKLTKTTASISGSIKLKLFAEIVVVANDLIPPKTAESRFSTTAGATAPFPANPRRSFDNGNLADSPDRLQFQPQATTASITEDRYMKSTTSNIFDIVWKKGEVLGVGSFGKVFSGINISNGTKMAIKEVYVHRSKNSKQQVKALQREVEILSQLDHPNIIHYLGTEFSDDRNTLRIFLELANEGSLKDSLREFGAFPEPLLRCYASDIVHGLLYLHQCKIIHRDIKPANLLLSNGVVKLADFGCSSPILSGGQTGIETEHSTIAGTTIYMAPEVMQAGSHLDENNNIDLEDNDGENNNNNQEKKAIKYGRKADIWSFGMTLCELANGESPYKNGAAAIYAVCISKQLPRFPAIFSAEAHDFLSRCLLYDVKQRADANELQQHIFMSPRSLEEVRAQTAASLSTTSHQNPMASSVQLAPDSEQFQFSTAMSSSGKLGGPSDPFFVSSDSTKLRETNTKRRSMRDESKYADDDHDDRISFHGNGVDDSSQFFTCFQQDRPVSMKYKSEDNEEARQTPRLTPRQMNHYASAPTLSTPRQPLHADYDDDEGKEGGDESRTATIVKDYLVLSANYSRIQENEGSRLNSSRRMTPRQESKKMMDEEEEEEVYEDDYEV